MDTVTYPNEQVAAYMNEHFVNVHLNTAQPKAVAAAIREFRQLWTPTFIFLDHHRIEVRRFVGYLPPAEFLPELIMARGMGAELAGKFAEAHDLFRTVAEQHASAAVAPEALFWAGVAAYKRDGGGSTGLMANWNELKDKHPDSTWRVRASFAVG